jgi:hypothetical protein
MAIRRDEDENDKRDAERRLEARRAAEKKQEELDDRAKREGL